ncbi:MAG TPA: RNA 2',3'-cyclic phosphodiesterase [Candidatus Dormibacteraeota bacterium]|nr:RNA 2',3'-cyclic phosphodiesterase [Candidatus Dormibacteraeota bacterium]
MRAFVALPVRPPALAQVQALAARLQSEVEEVRWAPTETVHITLHFFGQVSDERVAVAVRELEPVFAAQTPIHLRLSGLGSFPSNARPAVLWCGVAGDVDALVQLGQRCTSTLATAGFPVEQRPFRPHCTLGRPGKPWPDTARRRWSELRMQHPSTDTFTADVAILYESLTGPAGAHHHPRLTFPLCA